MDDTGSTSLPPGQPSSYDAAGNPHDEPTHVSGAAGGEVISASTMEPVAPVASPAPEPDDTMPESDFDGQDPGATGETDDAVLAGAEAGADVEADPRPLFSELGLSEPIVRAVEEKGYLHPTPIQEQAIPYVLMGRDVLGVAQTGTGKTASFTLPLLEILSDSRARARMPRSLILEPTRELALQVAENFVDYGRHLKLNHALLIGGESMSDQKDALMRGVDVLIATPGRLIDLFERGGLLLNDTRILVIDEADRMLDMGFIPDVERIVAMVSPMRQTLFFSATMAPEIRRLADAFLRNPKEITVARAASVTALIEAGLVLVDETDKRRALRALLRRDAVANALIFCNRKRDVDILARSLTKHGFSAGALHGDLPQSVRFATLERFKAGELPLLVCSDVAARGIDIGGLSHVFNFDVPIHSEDYIHRIGRTGRAGRSGHAITVAGPEDRLLVDAIERLIGAPIPRLNVDGVDTAEWAEIDPGRRRRGGRGGRGTRSDGRAGSAASRPGEHRRGSADGPPAKSGAVTPTRAAPRDAAGRGERQDRPAQTERPPRREAEAPRREQDGERDRPRDRDRDRDRARRDRPDASGARPAWRGREDLGPAVVAFGDETPGFMLLARRARVDVSSEFDETEPLRAERAGRPRRADPGIGTALPPHPETPAEPVIVQISLQEAPPPAPAGPSEPSVTPADAHPVEPDASTTAQSVGRPSDHGPEPEPSENRHDIEPAPPSHGDDAASD